MAFNYNHVTLMGRAVKEPDLKQINDNTSRLSFTLAVNRSYRKEDGTYDTDFVPITLWGKMAEVGFQMVQKGSPLLIWGRIRVRNYEKDNERKWMTEVVADNFQVLEKKSKKTTE